LAQTWRQNYYVSKLIYAMIINENAGKRDSVCDKTIMSQTPDRSGDSVVPLYAGYQEVSEANG
jgi:hypothetical protein